MTNVEKKVEEVEETVKKFVFNQNHFAVVLAVLTSGIVYLVSTYMSPETSGIGGAAVRISTASLQNTALWLLLVISFVEFLNGLKCNIYKEIIEEHNVALSILVGFAMISIAYCIIG